VLFNSARVHSYSTIKNSVLLDDVEVAEHCKLKNVIIDKHVKIPDGTVIGYNRADDEKRFHVIDLDVEEGTWLTAIPKAESPSKFHR
jgi:glucose-1-phosphate adenylyltransferase